MGFGILFLGYFVGFVMYLGNLSFFRVAGGALILLAALKLRKYQRTFGLLSIAAVVNIAVYAVKAVIDVLVYFAMMSSGGIVETVITYIHIPLTFAFHVCMLLGVRAIAKETETQKVYFASTRNLVFCCVLFVFQMVTLLPFEALRRLSVLATLFYLAVAVFNQVLIFNCYARICDADDVEMERKPSRFTFVNNMRDEFERRREEADRAREEKRRQKKNK